MVTVTRVVFMVNEIDEFNEFFFKKKLQMVLCSLMLGYLWNEYLQTTLRSMDVEKSASFIAFASLASS